MAALDSLMRRQTVDGEEVYGYRWVILALICLAVVAVNSSTFIFAGMAGILLDPDGAWALGSQQFVALTSCSNLTGFLFCIVTGTLADRLGTKPVLVAGLAVSALGAVARVFWGGFVGMFATSVVFGFGIAALNANSAKIIRQWFPRKMVGFAMGLYFFCANVGCAIAIPAAGLASDPRQAFAVVAALSLVTLALWAVLYRKHPQNERRIVEPVMSHLGVVVKSRYLWAACAVIGFAMAGNAVNNGYIVAALSSDVSVSGKGLDYGLATLIASLSNIACSLGTLVFPSICSRTHHEKRWLVGLAGTVALLVGFYWFLLDGVEISVGILLAYLLIGGVLPLAKALPAQLPDISPEHLGAAGGLQSTVQNAAAFLIPTYVVAPLCGLNYDLLNGVSFMALYLLAAVSACLLPRLVTGGAKGTAKGEEQE